MPKMRQAIAVLIAAAFCIGFNTYRYPPVWDMVAAAPQPSKPADSGAAATPAGSNEFKGDWSGESAANNHASAVCKDGVCTMPSPDTPVASMPGSMPSYGQSETKSAPGMSFESEPTSKDPDSESKSKEADSGYKEKGPESEYPSKTPESGYTPKDTDSGSMPRDTASGPMSKGSESEYPSNASESRYKPKETEPGSMPKDAASGPMSKGSESEYPSKTPESGYMPKGTESAYGPNGAATQPNPNDSGFTSDGHDQRADAAKTETFSYPSGPSDESRAERKPAARLVSDSYATRFPTDKSEDRPVAATRLVPIERPRSRDKDTAGTSNQGAGPRGPGYPRSDFAAARSTADRETDSQKARALPPTDEASGSDSSSAPPTITPELMRSYRVTPAK